ncbi:signal transduction histidine kinase [Xenococcus sp. PCC 7305]|uniref:sensor histidine kinase n=1 Tax=Xenococcus sp. PCC 7305 TaxID=102125 RepID=UPI0002ABECEF|nr:ATP-binding protein [Xenococcus sp. PCC 7305]ELS01435.1 signal transduction histidine kinase [Xenococcus sp. PCC 7305]
MQHLLKSHQIEKQILKVISNSHASVILNDLAAIMAELFQVDACGILSGDIDSAKNLEFGLWRNGFFTAAEKEHLSTVISEAVCSKSVLSRTHSKSHFSFSADILNGNCFAKTSLNIVTSFQGKANGALILLQPHSYKWTNSEQQLLETVADSMAIAISHIQLQQQAQIKTQHQNLLSRLSREISRNSDLDCLFSLVLSEIGQVLQVDRGKVLTLKYKDPFFSHRTRQQTVKATAKVAYNWSKETQDSTLGKDFSFQLADSSWLRQAFAQAPEALMTSRQANFPDFATESLTDGGAPEKSAALLIVPLMGKNTSPSQPALVLGFLVLESKQDHDWTTEEVEVVNWIAVQMSIAMIHHQTLNQVQSIVEERTAQLKWSLDVQAKLSEKMRQQIQQLRQLNELKDDFLSSMSHELKTPLTSMKMAIKMLRQPLPDDMRDKYLNILEQEWDREFNLIKDLLTLQQVESGELTFAPQELDFIQIADELAASFSKKWHSDRGLTLETHFSEPNLNFYSDLDSLNHILNELLLNAGKYAEPDTAVTLFANSHSTMKGKEIEIAIANDGPGIAEEELPHIFDKFRRGKGVTDRAVPGTGLGLALVKYLVEHLNGSISVTSEPLENPEIFRTVFTVKLPQIKQA